MFYNFYSYNAPTTHSISIDIYTLAIHIQNLNSRIIFEIKVCISKNTDQLMRILLNIHINCVTLLCIACIVDLIKKKTSIALFRGDTVRLDICGF